MGIQLFVPTFNVEECLEEIRDCLEKGWTGMGYKTNEFEEKWKEYTGFENAYFLNSNTVGLNLAFQIFKKEYGWLDDAEVITTPITFISTNHAILHANLKPVFADIDDTLCLDPKSVIEKITDKTKAVIFVGLGGNIGHYDEIVNICKENGLILILDAAHMSGSRWKGVIPGNEADAVVYSYQAVKNLPTADSGMICFKEHKFDEMARKMAWLGINKDTYARSSSGGNYKWKYDVEYLGDKLHGNSVMASIGLVQLKQLDKDNEYRRQISKWYTEGFKNNSNIKLVNVVNEEESSRHLYQIMVEDRDGLLAFLNENEIYPGVHYVDNTEYRMYSYAHGTCPNAEYVSDHIISLPLHMRLTKEDVELVIQKVLEFVSK